MKTIRKTKFILLIILMGLFTKTNAQDSLAKFKSYNISNSYFLNYLAFIKPNLAIVPCKGGIYCPNLSGWYLKSNDTILAAEPSYVDTSLIITLNSRNLFEIEKIFPDSTKKAKPLVITQGYVFYAVPNNFVKNQYFYVVGDSKGFSICKLHDRKVDTLLRSDTLIDQLQVINASTILYCIGNKIYCAPSGIKPYIVFDSGKDSLQGFTMNEYGDLYISLNSGIIKIAKDKKRTLIAGNTIKGKLRFFYKSLYVLDVEHGKLDIFPQL